MRQKVTGVAKPKPAPENEVVRTSVSLRAFIVRAYEIYSSEAPRSAPKNFTAFLELSAMQMLEGAVPGTIERAIAELRSGKAMPKKGNPRQNLRGLRLANEIQKELGTDPKR